jgi:hypothetical protein
MPQRAPAAYQLGAADGTTPKLRANCSAACCRRSISVSRVRISASVDRTCPPHAPQHQRDQRVVSPGPDRPSPAPAATAPRWPRPGLAPVPARALARPAPAPTARGPAGRCDQPAAPEAHTATQRTLLASASFCSLATASRACLSENSCSFCRNMSCMAWRAGESAKRGQPLRQQRVQWRVHLHFLLHVLDHSLFLAHRLAQLRGLRAQLLNPLLRLRATGGEASTIRVRESRMPCGPARQRRTSLSLLCSCATVPSARAAASSSSSVARASESSSTCAARRRRCLRGARLTVPRACSCASCRRSSSSSISRLADLSSAILRRAQAM